MSPDPSTRFLASLEMTALQCFEQLRPNIRAVAPIVQGELHKLVVARIEIHQEDLMADWGSAAGGHNPLPIRGLDQ
uniref:Uncharacterized protein n=1 Tax=Candidatus Kentrum sp. FW TaxID=2126338 RepID=A0A450TZU9_9GAMM|nr:MAG: hypothetical protein BECKFW1821C_GA0114237_108120 [Candidatus Kentron sp. FW]